jgi:hypothetical protein
MVATGQEGGKREALAATFTAKRAASALVGGANEVQSQTQVATIHAKG